GRDTVGDVTYFIEVLRIWREQGDKPRVGEKTPKHERTIERILEIFPKARFIQVIRDPRDVAASIQALGWAEHGTLARSAEMLAQVYDRHFQREASLSAQQYIAVRYEDLIADAEGELRRLSDFLGEPFDEEMLRFNEREDSGFMERERGWKELTLKPLTTARVGRYRDKLTPRQVRTVEHVLGSRLQRLGYAREADMPDKLSWRIADASAVMTWRLWRIVRPLVRTIRPNRPRVTRAESTRATTGS
ncbi:MAG: sulfotransferase, partial [Planctomycetota bacterium]